MIKYYYGHHCLRLLADLGIKSRGRTSALRAASTLKVSENSTDVFAVMLLIKATSAVDCREGFGVSVNAGLTLDKCYY